MARLGHRCFAFADLPAFFAAFVFFFTALLLAAVSSLASEAAGFSAFTLAALAVLAAFLVLFFADFLAFGVVFSPDGASASAGSAGLSSAVIAGLVFWLWSVSSEGRRRFRERRGFLLALSFWLCVSVFPASLSAPVSVYPYLFSASCWSFLDHPRRYVFAPTPPHLPLRRRFGAPHPESQKMAGRSCISPDYCSGFGSDSGGDGDYFAVQSARCTGCPDAEYQSDVQKGDRLVSASTRIVMPTGFQLCKRARFWFRIKCYLWMNKDGDILASLSGGFFDNAQHLQGGEFTERTLPVPEQCGQDCDTDQQGRAQTLADVSSGPKCEIEPT